MEITKSSALIQKENELKKLRKKHKKTLTQVKRTRTMLKNMQDDIEAFQKNMGTGIMQNFYDIKKLQDELLELLKEAQKAEKVSAEDREQARMLYNEISENGFIPEDELPFSWEELEEKMENRGANFNTDENDRQRAYAFFQEFVVAPDAEEEKDIRKVYLRLANRFHPDKAKNDSERTFFHDMMQQIIKAKERGDIAALQAIETEHLNSGTTTIDATETSVILDAMDEHIAKVRHQTMQLERQLQRLKQELGDLKESDLGQALKAEKRMQRQDGVSTEQMANDASEMRANLIVIRDGIKELIETGTLSEEALAALQPQGNPFDDLFDPFGDFDDEDWDEDEEGNYTPKSHADGFRYNENDGRFYSPNYTKADLAGMSKEEEDDFMDNPFGTFAIPPDIMDIRDKVANGTMTAEQAQAAMIKKIQEIFGE